MIKIVVELEAIKMQKGDITIPRFNAGKVIPYYCNKTAEILSESLTNKLIKDTNEESGTESLNTIGDANE